MLLTSSIRRFCASVVGAASTLPSGAALSATAGTSHSARAASAHPPPSFLTSLPATVADPLEAVRREFENDENPHKCLLVSSYYSSSSGEPYVMDVVRRVGVTVPEPLQLVPAGSPEFLRHARALALCGTPGDGCVTGDATTTSFSPSHPIVSFQTLGSVGGLRLIAEVVRRFGTSHTIFIPRTGDAHHAAVLREGGLNVHTYAYYDARTKQLDLAGLLRDLGASVRGSLVLLHACGHNPTGVDPSPAEWERILDLVAARGLVPLVYLGFQGLASGDLAEDSLVVREAMRRCGTIAIAQSFSSNFSLRALRLGCIHILCKDDKEAALLRAQMGLISSCLYDGPPALGAQIVTRILSDPTLAREWQEDIKAMAARLQAKRVHFVEELRKAGSAEDWSHVTRQRGFYSQTGLRKDAIVKLKKKWHIYLNTDGRICVTDLRREKIDYIARAVHDVTK